ncbi:hypothetical protein M427DRAFT_141078 [Gonapodya prolifera JEL478]|uniref:PWI domain-containing protein n=1 Tax=Gonapodya prolifera (strain JEL478) TaxID=1344416 RepID=A0A138ZXX7_GONPJ|nr:hypothetical protein M427DRAFT_141078 [Gonapodya prolifera JEL478]|eukprot:KXS09291.1 hypothetical protein M427DRAFT_141078 [Gonapodya prolifera JEL478]
MASFPPPMHMGPPMGMPPMPPGSMGGPPMGVPPPGAPIAPIVERRIPKDVRLTVYIGRITDGVADEHVEKLLRVCGPIRAWKRVQDATNKIHPAGLVEFETLEGMHKCEMLLSGGQFGGNGLELPNPHAGVDKPDGEEDPKLASKSLIVTIGEAAKMATEEFKRTYKLDAAELNRLRGEIENIVNLIRTSLTNRPASPVLLDSQGDPVPREVREIYKRIAASTREVNQTLAQLFPGLQPDELDDLPPDQIMENQELVLKEIATFRRQQARRELEKRTEIDRADRSRRDDEERRKDIAAGLTPEFPGMGRQPDGWVRGGSLSTGEGAFGREAASATGAPGEDIDEEEEEAKKEARRQKEMEIAFKDREKRWESRESARFRKFDQEDLRDRDDEGRAKKNREIMERRLREFDDDYEREQMEYEWFRDRQRWIERRRIHRARERADDEQDRKLEAEEIEAEQRAEAEALQAAQVATNGTVPAPVTLEVDKFLARYQISGDQVRERDRDRYGDRDGDRDRVPTRPFAPPAGSGPVGRIMTAEERKRAQTELVDEIPAAREPLFGWRVRWEVVDENLLTTKLRSFISRKLQSLLGEEVPDIADHVVDHLRQRKTPDALWEEMKEVLDEESERFVCLVWRMLVYETESRVRGL